MKKITQKLEAYDKACKEAGLTYGQMQQKETKQFMTRSKIPDGYKKVSEWQKERNEK